MDGIQVSVEKIGPQNDISIIRVGGYIDTTTSSELERALDGLLKTGVFRIVIDLGNVDYISSAGWGIFISEIKGIRERGGDLKLARMIPDVYEVFELLEFHYILKAFDTVDDALSSYDVEGGALFIDRGVSADTETIGFDARPEETPLKVEDKIKAIAEKNPGWGASKISKALNKPEWGNTKLGTIGVWKALKKLRLDKGRVEEMESA
jgi:anti-sigma B factor antagonist